MSVVVIGATPSGDGIVQAYVGMHTSATVCNGRAGRTHDFWCPSVGELVSLVGDG